MIGKTRIAILFLRIEIGSTILFKNRIGIGSNLLLNSIRSFFFLIKLEVKVLKFMLMQYIF